MNYATKYKIRFNGQIEDAIAPAVLGLQLRISNAYGVPLNSVQLVRCGDSLGFNVNGHETGIVDIDFDNGVLAASFFGPGHERLPVFANRLPAIPHKFKERPVLTELVNFL